MNTSEGASVCCENDAGIPLTMKDEEKEIAQLEADILSHASEKDVNRSLDECDEKVAVHFDCYLCNMCQIVDYFGKSPPFIVGLQFLEETYVMRDPFQAPLSRLKSKPEYFVALGANCIICNESVCRDVDCSFFYTKTYCLNCAKLQLPTFPLETQSKLKKQIQKI